LRPAAAFCLEETMPEPIVATCTQCLGSPVTVAGDTIRVCGACVAQEPLPRVNLVAHLAAQVSRLQDRLAEQHRVNDRISGELALLAHPESDRQRILACLGSTIGISTEALRGGAIWGLISAARRSIDITRRGLRANNDAHPDYKPGCTCAVCHLERELAALTQR
jgi:hypothetical protein